ncbi:Tau-tubulin kinase 1 [Toxocara canis]|uniref:non-specific serine/threonine protein kinase n=1 Tax=Toxocara canis TaxID=6265 RepID=A0A0B2VF11_TOXCA|nr:Tau-tubulin kinase 1 [Toxocara canis]
MTASKGNSSRKGRKSKKEDDGDEVRQGGGGILHEGSSKGRHSKTKLKDEDEKLVASSADDDEEEVERSKGRKKKKKGPVSTKKTDESAKVPKKSPPKSSVGPITRKKMTPGVIINTYLHKFEILSVLGAGGFGDVYKVRQLDNVTPDKKGIYALKTETTGPTGKALNRLKLENGKHCLGTLGRTDSEKNFCALVDLLRVGFCTTIKLGLETVQAIEHLHDIGYIHRDVKPQNFTIGVDDKADNIYLLDFGIARRYIEKDSRAIRIPRKQVKFLGTIRFASRNCHLGKEQCRRDDLESWLYMLLEFTEFTILPWSRTLNREVVLREKQRLFNGYFTKAIDNLPTPIHKIIFYIDDLTYQSAPDYEYIAMALKRAAAIEDVDLNEPFDWKKKDTERDEVESNKEIGSSKKRKGYTASLYDSKKAGVERDQLGNPSLKPDGPRSLSHLQLHTVGQCSPLKM